jgi:Flp pilus assembly protein TadG
MRASTYNRLKILATARMLAQDCAGNILPLTAMSVFVLTALIGSAVDLSRVYHAQNRLQSVAPK